MEHTLKAHDRAATKLAEPYTRVYRWLVLGVVTFSLADGVLTAGELWSGVAREGNPVIGALLASHPLLALGFKVAITFWIASVMWLRRDSATIRAITAVTFVGYGALIAYHLGGLSGLGVI